MRYPKTNMIRGKSNRKRRKVGEIFTFSVLEGEYYWGRVICLDVNMWGFDSQKLVYLYNISTHSTESIPPLDKNNLLIPPLGLANGFWSDGYFQTVAVLPLPDEDRFERHCFRSGIRGSNEFRDEFNNPVDEPFEPLGRGGAPNIRAVDTRISEALGIEPIPDDPY